MVSNNYFSQINMSKKGNSYIQNLLCFKPRLVKFQEPYTKVRLPKF